MLRTLPDQCGRVRISSSSTALVQRHLNLSTNYRPVLSAGQWCWSSLMNAGTSRIWIGFIWSLSIHPQRTNKYAHMHTPIPTHTHTSLLKDFPLGLICLTLFHKLTCDSRRKKTLVSICLTDFYRSIARESFNLTSKLTNEWSPYST